jgi:hypothetical protein
VVEAFSAILAEDQEAPGRRLLDRLAFSLARASTSTWGAAAGAARRRPVTVGPEAVLATTAEVVPVPGRRALVVEAAPSSQAVRS